ncbi:hypothetical protein Ddc_15366 [Ditylenchus destructor]|nr:hypothetical protein Ddc_15366 [Ditylenchus destructor]
MGNANFRCRSIKVEIPEDCMLDVLKCLTCPEWSKMRYVSRQINGIVQRNYMRLSLVIIENAFMNQKVNRTANDEDYHNCAQLSKQTHFQVKLQNSIIAYETVIPQSEAVHWFETRGVALEAPEDVPVERALVGIDFALGSSVDYQKWNIIQLFILGPVQRNGDMRKSWFKHLRLKEKMYDSVVFYAQFHPPNQFSRASLEQFLTFLFHPSTYVKVIRMLAVDQKIVDVVKHKMSTCFSTCGSHQNSNNNNGFYIHCGTFWQPVFKEGMSIYDLRKFLKWLEWNVRANSICISPSFMGVDIPVRCNLLTDFVFEVSPKCAKQEIRLICLLKVFKANMLTNLVQHFWSLPPIQCEIPTIVIEEFNREEFHKSCFILNLEPNQIESQVDSQGAEYLHVLENGQNRMRISLCEVFHRDSEVRNQSIDYSLLILFLLKFTMDKIWIDRLKKDEAKKYLDQALVREEKLKEELRNLQEANGKLAIALDQVTAANLKLVAINDTVNQNVVQQREEMQLLQKRTTQMQHGEPPAPNNMLSLIPKMEQQNAEKCRAVLDPSFENQHSDGVPLGNGQKMWFVDDIIGQKRINGTVHYKVKWCGLNDPTWEPEDHIEMNNGQPYCKKKRWDVERLIGHKRVNGELFYLVKWVNWEDPNWECADNVKSCTSALKKYWTHQRKL